ncbi:MAG: hypothetical protein HDR13_13175 [Lachnospiraceae bacterium]|nr:hypothetical protein [Lachnospiraceae bacterium]
MKSVRYIFSGLLIAAALLIGCDLFQIFLYDFEDFWQTSFYVQDGIGVEQMKEQIFDSAEKYELEVIYIDKYIEGDYYTRIDVYCTPAAEEMFAREYQLSEGHYGSLFSGESDVVFHTVEELSGERMQKEPEQYYILGCTENATAYKAELVDTYGGSLPRPKERDSMQEALKRLIWIWLVVGILIWIQTYYKTIQIRKEIVVRLSLGESIERIVLLHALIDILWYCLCFFATSLILYRIYHCLFLWNYEIIALAVIILGDTIIYASLLRCDLKLGFSGVRMSRKLLNVSYMLKTLLTLALSVSAATTIALSTKYIDLEKQREFYEARKAYSYLYLINSSGYMETWFYRNYFTMFDMQFICGNGSYDWKDQDKLAICINANMKDYLCESLPSVADKISKCKACVLIPEREEVTDDAMEILLDASASFANLEENDVAVIYYSDHPRIINYDVYRGYVRSYCPVIIYNNCIEDARPIEEGRILFELNFGKVMMKPDVEELDRFCEEHECQYLQENVWLTFEHELQNVKRGVIMNIVLLLFQCAVELCLSAAIIRLEFETNRLEIIMKKILGYSVIERIGRQFIMTITSSVAGIVGAWICYKILGLEHAGLMCAVVVILMLIETAVMFGRFLHIEQDSIQRTLKGGFL